MVIHLHTTDERDAENRPIKIFSNRPHVSPSHRRTAQNRTMLCIVTPSGIPHFELFIPRRKDGGKLPCFGDSRKILESVFGVVPSKQLC